MKIVTIALCTALLAVMSGCGPKSTDASATNANAADGTVAGEVKRGAGTGRVVSVDAASGTITLAHGPIPGVGWPAMTMGFKAMPADLGGISAGDQVSFDLTLRGSEGTITSIKKRPG